MCDSFGHSIFVSDFFFFVIIFSFVQYYSHICVIVFFLYHYTEVLGIKYFAILLVIVVSCQIFLFFCHILSFVSSNLRNRVTVFWLCKITCILFFRQIGYIDF